MMQPGVTKARYLAAASCFFSMCTVLRHPGRADLMREKPLDLRRQSSVCIGLFQQLGGGAAIRRADRRLRFARREEDLHGRKVDNKPFSQRFARHPAGHIGIREDQRDGLARGKYGKGLSRVRGFKHAVAGFAQMIRRCHPDQYLVFDDKNRGFVFSAIAGFRRTAVRPMRRAAA